MHCNGTEKGELNSSTTVHCRCSENVFEKIIILNLFTIFTNTHNQNLSTLGKHKSCYRQNLVIHKNSPRFNHSKRFCDEQYRINV